jgi:hypothetical protein
VATAPAGTVRFSATDAGAFAGNPCLLSPAGASAAGCQVTFTPSKTGAATITAAYGGDAVHLGSSAATALTVTNGTYVALGDSYSAGTGAPPYIPDYSCLQSASSWPYLVGANLGFTGSMFSFHPCAGATVEKLTQSQQSPGGDQEPPQNQWLCTPGTRQSREVRL